MKTNETKKKSNKKDKDLVKISVKGLGMDNAVFTCNKKDIKTFQKYLRGTCNKCP